MVPTDVYLQSSRGVVAIPFEKLVEWYASEKYGSNSVAIKARAQETLLNFAPGQVLKYVGEMRVTFSRGSMRAINKGSVFRNAREASLPSLHYWLQNPEQQQEIVKSLKEGVKIDP